MRVIISENKGYYIPYSRIKDVNTLYVDFYYDEYEDNSNLDRY